MTLGDIKKSKLFCLKNRWISCLSNACKSNRHFSKLFLIVTAFSSLLISKIELITMSENLWLVSAHDGHNDTLNVRRLVVPVVEALFNRFYIIKHNIPLPYFFFLRVSQRNLDKEKLFLQRITVSLKNRPILIPFTLRSPIIPHTTTPQPKQIEWWPLLFPLLLQKKKNWKGEKAFKQLSYSFSYFEYLTLLQM